MLAKRQKQVKGWLIGVFYTGRDDLRRRVQDAKRKLYNAQRLHYVKPADWSTFVPGHSVCAFRINQVRDNNDINAFLIKGFVMVRGFEPIKTHYRSGAEFQSCKLGSIANRQ